MVRGMKLLAAAAATAIIAAVAAGSAAAYDRQPLHIRGLRPDGWGQTVTAAGAALRQRYPGVRADYCTGVIMIGYESASWSVNGMTRYWDKLVCLGRTYSGSYFGLVFDQKGPRSWIIYRLNGATLDELRG
jgi:hypothetical protein